MAMTSLPVICAFCMVASLLVVHVSGRSIATTDLSLLLHRLNDVLTTIERRLQDEDKTSAAVAEVPPRLQLKRHRMPFPEANLELEEKSMKRAPSDDALLRIITLIERQRIADEEDDGIASSDAQMPAEDDPLSTNELERLLSILQKRDWDAPFPVMGSSNSHLQ